jgi:putative hydrolase of the HAD superfamily
MSLPLDTCAIQAILFDMNGTLRTRELHPETQEAAYARLRLLLGMPDVKMDFWEELTRRQKTYACWAQENLVQKTEAEIWADWMLPGSPKERFEGIAADLMLAWQERKGRAVPKPGAGEIIQALRQRGYHLGVISNTMSTLDIPSSLEAFGWNDHFEVVILSANIKLRKPSPEPFLEAARRMDITPNHCAFVGNRLSKDIAGCRQAGYALGLVLEPASGPRPDELDSPVKPDGVIHSLAELLDLFPGPGYRVHI